MSSIALVGSTGLIGSHVLKQLINSNTESLIPICRREPKDASPKLHSFINSDSATWAPHLKSLAPPIFISSLGASRAASGSVEAQRKIDLDLNLALATAAREVGTKVYVLVSSGGSSSTSMFAYMKMKGELEDAVKKLGFPYCVIVRPGLILGQREKAEFVTKGLNILANVTGMLSGSLKEKWALEADIIARACVNAAFECSEGKREEGIWMLEQAEIARLGKIGKEK